MRALDLQAVAGVEDPLRQMVDEGSSKYLESAGRCREGRGGWGRASQAIAMATMI